ncbi:hypothetical protein GGS20DRAFT_243418 [Poronia punctata]|nr:hypothetical protein GGS20DRAFT_243418 [Poronia punctata]
MGIVRPTLLQAYLVVDASSSYPSGVSWTVYYWYLANPFLRTCLFPLHMSNGLRSTRHAFRNDRWVGVEGSAVGSLGNTHERMEMPGRSKQELAKLWSTVSNHRSVIEVVIPGWRLPGHLMGRITDVTMGNVPTCQVSTYIVGMVTWIVFPILLMTESLFPIRMYAQWIAWGGIAHAQDLYSLG